MPLLWMFLLDSELQPTLLFQLDLRFPCLKIMQKLLLWYLKATYTFWFVFLLCLLPILSQHEIVS